MWRMRIISPGHIITLFVCLCVWEDQSMKSKMTLVLCRWLFFGSLLLTVKSQDDINVTLKPVVLSADEGEDANFTCSPLLVDTASSLLNTIAPGSSEAESIVSSSPLITVTDVIGDPSVRIFTWLDSSLDDHGREFFCQFGAFTSNIATLYINQAPTIDISETDFSLDAEQSLNVSLTVGGWPIPTLQWTLNGETIGNSSTRTLSSSGLLISSVSLGDAGTYMLTALNDIGSASVTFTVTVRSSPVFKGGEEERISVKQGGEIEIDCSATAYPAIQSITLTTGDDQLLALDSNFTHIISDAKPSDAKTYECTATNELGLTTRTVVVEVGELPGTVSDITAKGNSDGGVTVEWVAAKGNGAEIVRYTIVIEYGERQITRMVDGTETMLTVTRQDLGVDEDSAELLLTIRITAENGIGEGEEIAAMAPVKVEPLTPTSAALTPTLAASTAVSFFPKTLLTVLLIVVCTAFYY